MFLSHAEVLQRHSLGIMPVHMQGQRIAAAPELAGEEPSPPSGGCFPTNFSWHGGIVIPHPKVVIVTWSASTPYTMATILAATTDITEGGFLTATTEFGGGPGIVDQTVHNLGQSASGVLADATIQAALLAAIGSGALPQPDYQTCYLVLTPPNVVVSAFGVQSCQYFCGYHGILGDAVSFYAVIPDNQCYACHGPNDPLAAYTAIISHEIGEWVTDPDTAGPTGWLDAHCSENGDICAWQITSYNTWSVQPLWTNSQQCLVPAWGGNHPPARIPRATSFTVDQITPGTAVNTGDTVSFRITATMPTLVEGSIDLGFGGMGDKLHFTSSDGAAVLPADYQMTYTDRGRHSFVAAVTFRSPGAQTFTVKSDLHPSITGTSATFTVTSVNPPVNPPGTALIAIEAALKHPVSAQTLFQNVEVVPNVPVSKTGQMPLEALSPRHVLSPPAQLIVPLETTLDVHARSTPR